MKRLLLLAALAVIGCGKSAPAGQRVGTDIHFPAVPSGSGSGIPDGGVAISTVDGGNLTGNGTKTAPLNALGVAADNLVKATVDGGTEKTILELNTAYTNQTPGTEATKLRVSLLSGGTQVLALDLRTGQVLAQNGAAGADAFGFQASPGTGFWWDSTNTRIGFDVTGTTRVFLGNDNNVYLTGGQSTIFFSNALDTAIGRSGAGALQLSNNTAGVIIGNHTNIPVGFFGSAGATKGAVSGSRGSNAALASLLTLLASYGIVTDSSSP